jgi:DNA-binding CsgD family transcriptional regulator
VREIISELKQNLDETSWREFEYRFARVHESFYDTLDAQFPDLTPAERKVCAMLKLNMSSKEIAAITMVRPESVDTARSRIRKKLDIDKDENLTEFLNRL